MLEDLGMDDDVGAIQWLFLTILMAFVGKWIMMMTRWLFWFGWFCCEIWCWDSLVGWGSCPSAQCERCYPEEGDHLGHLSQGAGSQGELGDFHVANISGHISLKCGLLWRIVTSDFWGWLFCKNISAGWPSPTWGWREQGEEDRWHLHLGRRLPQGLLLWFLSISSFPESFRRSDSWKGTLKRHCLWWMCEQAVC